MNTMNAMMLSPNGVADNASTIIPLTSAISYALFFETTVSSAQTMMMMFKNFPSFQFMTMLICTILISSALNPHAISVRSDRFIY